LLLTAEERVVVVEAITAQDRIAKQNAEAIAAQERQAKEYERHQKEKLEAYLRSLGVDPDLI
jgi:hypothetical protein